MSTTKHEEARKQAALDGPSLTLLFWIGGVLLTLAALDASLRSPREWALNGILLVSSTVALWQGCLAIAARGARRYFSFGFLFVWCLLHYLNDPARELLTSVPHFEREVGDFFEWFYPSQSGSRRFAPIATEYVILFGAVLGGFVTRRAFESDQGERENTPE